MLCISKLYGALHVNYGIGRRALLSFVRNNTQSILALITHNSELLTFNDDFQYWDLSGVNFYNLTIEKFRRQELSEKLGLNMKEMQLFFIISQIKPIDDFNSLLRYVKEQECGTAGFNFNRMMDNFTFYQLKKIDEQLQELITLSTYNKPWDQDVYREPIKNLMDADRSFADKIIEYKDSNPFVYKLINEWLTVQKDLLFIDLRRTDSNDFIYFMVCTMIKLCDKIFQSANEQLCPQNRFVYHGYNGKVDYMERKIEYSGSKIQNCTQTEQHF